MIELIELRIDPEKLRIQSGKLRIGPERITVQSGKIRIGLERPGIRIKDSGLMRIQDSGFSQRDSV